MDFDELRAQVIDFINKIDFVELNIHNKKFFVIINLDAQDFRKIKDTIPNDELCINSKGFIELSVSGIPIQRIGVDDKSHILFAIEDQKPEIHYLNSKKKFNYIKKNNSTLIAENDFYRSRLSIINEIIGDAFSENRLLTQNEMQAVYDATITKGDDNG